MKLKKIFIIAAAMVLVGVGGARAEHDYNWSMKDRFTYAHEGEVFMPHEFTFDAYGSYTTRPRNSVGQLFSHNIRHGNFGGGAGLNYFFTKHIGIGADTIIGDNGGKFLDSVSG